MGADHKYRTVHAVVLEISPYLICDNFPKFLLLYFSQLLKIQLRILPWDIVDTISELAKTEQGETEVFRNRTDNVRQPYIVRQV